MTVIVSLISGIVGAVVTAIIGGIVLLRISKSERAADREREVVEAASIIVGLLASRAQRMRVFRTMFPNLDNKLLDVLDPGRLDKMVEALSETGTDLAAAIGAHFRIETLTDSTQVLEATEKALEVLEAAVALGLRREQPTEEDWDTWQTEMAAARHELAGAVKNHIPDLQREVAASS